MPSRKRRTRRQFNRRKHFDKPLRVSIGERTGWSPPKDVYPVNPNPERAAQASQPPSNTLRKALPALATSIGFATQLEVLPGEPPTIAFTAGNSLRGLFILPGTEREVRDVIGLPAAEIRDHHADRLWEEARHEG